MRMRVLFVVPETDELAAQSEIAMTTMGVAVGTDPASVILPAGFELDEQFDPVPIEGPRAGGNLVTFASTTAVRAPSPVPASPSAYVVRGFIESSDLQKVTQACELSTGETRLFSDPDIGLMQTCGGDPPVGHDGDVRRLLQAGRLRQLGMYGHNVGIVIIDNGINLSHLHSRGIPARLDIWNSHSPATHILPGTFPVEHGTMCAYEALLMAPSATLLDFAVLRTPRSGGSVMDGTLSEAVLAYGKLLKLMLLPDEERLYHSLVVNNSWGMFHPSWDFPPTHPGRYADNSSHPFNVIVGSLAQAGVDILFAAGNCGPTCPDRRCQGQTTNTITGANSHADVLTVGGVDINDALAGYSSQGPGALKNDKPDFVTYTHFSGSEAFGRGTPDSGTSAACPVAAGVVAALRSQRPYGRTNGRTPGVVQNFLRQHATRRGSGATGWQSNDGYGILTTADFDQASTYIP
jgi:hypothetical protein